MPPDISQAKECSPMQYTSSAKGNGYPRPVRRLSDSSYGNPSVGSSSMDRSTDKNQSVGSVDGVSRQEKSKLKGGILKIRRRSSFSSDDEGGGSKSASTIDDDIQKKQDRKVCMLRGAMIMTLLTATAVVAALTYVYVRNDEESNFRSQYLDSVAKVAEAFQDGLDTKHNTASTFSAMYTSRYGNSAQESMGQPPVWPNATMPDFQEQADGQLKLAGGRALSFNPIITHGVNRLTWEAHATESAWILGDDNLVDKDPNLPWPKNRTVSDGIYSRDENGNVVYDGGYSAESRFPEVLVPVWQIAPIKTNEKAVMFNLHWEKNRQRALDDMLSYRVPALTAILQLVQDEETRPSSILFYPVFDEFDYTIENINRTVVGSISIVFSWDALLDSILPDYIKGLICVLKSSTNQEYSYSISGDKVTLLGEGDLHDRTYEGLGRVVKANLGRTKELLGEVDYLITYQLMMYPSQEFEDQYLSNNPAIYTAGVVLIFMCTAALFLLYDYLVEDRQQKTARLARQTSHIVDSMFPAAFRDRLYKSQDDGGVKRRASLTQEGMANRRGSDDGTIKVSNTKSEGERTIRRTSTIGGKSALKQISKFMKNAVSSPADHDPPYNSGGVEDEPIADLFLDTSIMFSDIVGFTKWSSERSPNEVFRLLEHLFWEFDEIASRLNVFKLGTIGDCYIAVTGIPDPISDHAVILSRFAFECRDKVQEVCAELEQAGLDTAKLDMRFGIHSGAITAGILRGTKSRFELFGDTINTASRMESTGMAGKIQVSSETADLLRFDHKERWLIKRDEMITAKGKGQLQTYWIEPRKEGNRVSFSDMAGDSLTESKILRLSSNTEQLFHNEFDSSDRRPSEWDEEKLEEILADRDDLMWAPSIDLKASDDANGEKE